MVALTNFALEHFLTGIGFATYLAAKLGSDPRDGFMKELQWATWLPIAFVRNPIDLIVLFVGWNFGVLKALAG